jgi:hypothetical protein
MNLHYYYCSMKLPFSCCQQILDLSDKKYKKWRIRIPVLFSCGTASFKGKSPMTRNHKILTYIEYRAVSGVFRTIDPPPPLHPASVSSPRTKGGGHTLAGRGGGGGGIFRKTPDIGLVKRYNPSTQGTHLEVWSRGVRCVDSWLGSTHWQRGIKLGHETVKKLFISIMYS